MPQILALLSACVLLSANAVASGTGKEPAGYTYALFDGETLAGWTIENDCVVEVQDGALLLKSGNGWLRSHHTYGDFRLQLECQALQAENYDAGIYIRTQPGGAPFPGRGYQVNLLQGKVGAIGNLPGAAPAGVTIHPAGEWNAFEIDVRGDTVAVTINGKLAYRAAGLEIDRGHVGLQVEVPKGGQFLVRNIRVTELDHRTLFDGRELAHWEGADGPAETCWEIRDGLLHCTESKGPWLRSREQFEDFNLRLEYRLTEGGNSGVYVRVPENGNHHRENDDQPPAGFEVQILDDSAAKYRDLMDYQFSASVYDIAGANPRVSKPPGEWNTLEIDCRGHHVTTVHNGVTVVDVAAESHPAITLRNLSGYLGLQNHGGGVSFRNLRVGPATEPRENQ
jgi:hypothetical protein